MQVSFDTVPRESNAFFKSITTVTALAKSHQIGQVAHRGKHT